MSAEALALRYLGPRTRRAEMLQKFEANGNMATKFLRTFAVQMETLARVRRGGKQKVIVEHVHVYPGGKAAVGTFVQQQPGGGGGEFEIEGQAHAIAGPDAIALLSGGAAMWGENPERQPVPIVAGDGQEPLPDCTAAHPEAARLRAYETEATNTAGLQSRRQHDVRGSRQRLSYRSHPDQGRRRGSLRHGRT